MTVRRLLYAIREFGIDPTKTLGALQAIPTLLSDVIKFRHDEEHGKLTFSPVLLDFKSSAGAADGHYFWQDLICAQWINLENPSQHFDVGSRVDGFIAHLLSTREIISLDIRPLAVEIPRLKVALGNAQEPLRAKLGEFDSVSSLHSVEHFGLGRYRDALDSSGHIKGIRNIADCVKIGGNLYLSFPIGVPEVQFNAQRILKPTLLSEILPDFSLIEFVLIPWKGQPILNTRPEEVDTSIKGQAGLFKLKREY
jgi:hypothetical protein